MSVREASQFPTVYPTSSFEPEKKAKVRSGPPSESQNDDVSTSAPRMGSRRTPTRVPPNPRKKNASEAAGSAFASTEPRQLASRASSNSSPASYTSTSSTASTSSTPSTSSISSTANTSSSARTNAAKSVAPAHDITSPAVNKPIVFKRDEKVSKYLTGDDVMLTMTAKLNAAFVTKQVNELVELQRLRKEDPAKLRAGESPFVTIGKEILANLKPIQGGPTPSTVASCLWLVSATPVAEGDKMKQFFDLAIAFSEKGIDLPSLIVNDAIEKRNAAFLTRLQEAYPDTNLGELYRNKF